MFILFSSYISYSAVRTYRYKTLLYGILSLIGLGHYAHLTAGQVDEHARKQAFHERIMQTHPEYFNDHTESFYKTIEPLTSTPLQRNFAWRIISVSLAGNIVNGEEGVYHHEQLYVRLSLPADFNPTQSLTVPAVYQGNHTLLRLDYSTEKKCPALPSLNCYNQLIRNAQENRLFLTHEIIMRGLIQIPHQEPILVVMRVQNQQWYPITLHGIEYVCNKQDHTTNIFIDFTDHLNQPINQHFPILYRHAPIHFDHPVYLIKNHRLYTCDAESIKGFFNSPEIHTHWVPNDTVWYNFNQRTMSNFPFCYKDPLNTSETLEESIVWVFDPNNDSLYKREDNPLLTISTYIYSNLGQLPATRNFTQTLTNLSSHERSTCSYLEKVAQPTLRVHDTSILHGESRLWPNGVYKRSYHNNQVFWQEIDHPTTEPIQFLNRSGLDGLSVVWPTEENPDTPETVRSWNTVAAHQFPLLQGTLHNNRLRAAIYCDAFSTITSLDLSNITLNPYNNPALWKAALISIGAMHRLTELSLTHNHPINTLSALYRTLPTTLFSREHLPALAYYQQFAECLSNLRRLKKLAIQGLWLKPHEALGTGYTPGSPLKPLSVSPEIALLTDLIYQSHQTGIGKIIQNISQLPELEELSLDGIPDQGSSNYARNKARTHSYLIPLQLFFLPGYVLESGNKTWTLSALSRNAAHDLARNPSLRTITVYSPGGNCVDYFSRTFREQLHTTRTHQTALTPLTINAQVLS